MTFKPIYRTTVYAARSVTNPDETAVLTPAGAHHSQEFKIASAQGVSGFQPYMKTIPRGRKSRLDPVSKKLDIGAISFMLGDFRDQGTSDNFRRWATAFLGDATGKNRMLGLKMLIEESLNGGASWQAYYVGRITEFKLSGLTQYKVIVKEENSLQKRVKVFAGEPSGSVLGTETDGGYANRRLFLPMGRPEHEYGPWKRTFGFPVGQWRIGKNTRNRVISNILDATNAEAGQLWVTKPLLEAIPEVGFDSAFNKESDVGYGPIIEVSNLNGANKSRYFVTYMKQVGTGFAFRTPNSAGHFLLEEIPDGEFRKASLSQFGDGQLIRWRILDNREISKTSPLLISDVHPAQYWKDLLKGAFSILDGDGEAVFRNTFAIEEDDFDTLIADEATYKLGRFPQIKEFEMSKAIEEQVLKPYNFGYRMEPTTGSSGVGVNKIVPFSMNLPESTAGIPTITEDDLVAGSKPTWEPGEPLVSFETKYYQDRQKDLVEVEKGEEENPSLWSEGPIFIRTLDLDNVHAGEGEFKIDAKGIRFAPFELIWIPGPILPQPILRSNIYTALAQSFHNINVFRWSRGPSKVSIRARRSGSIEDTKVGNWRLLDVAMLPGEFGHIRGETRLAQCVERTEQGPNLALRFVDSGRNIQIGAPTLGTWSRVPNTNSISGSVTVTQTSEVQGAIAFTDLSVGTRPAETASLWQQFYFTEHASGTHEVFLGNVPSGQRVWPRFRAWSVTEDELQLPSDWAFPDNDYVDITALSAPSNLTLHNITKESVALLWTNAPVTASTQVLVKPAISSSFTMVTVLGQGTDRYNVINLSPSASLQPWTAGVRYMDQFGGLSVIVSASFTASGDFNKTCPPIGGIQIVEVIDDREIIPLE